MRKEIFLLTFLLLPTLMFSQWEKMSDNIPESWGIANCIDAYSKDIVVISIRTDPPRSPYVTTDGGNTWVKTNFEPAFQLEEAVDISFVDSTTFVIGTGYGRILKTTNLGDSYTEVFFDTSLTSFINYVEMFNETEGIAMGDSYIDDQFVSSGPIAILHTTDGGNTWTQTDNELDGYFSGDVWHRIDFVSPEVGYFAFQDSLFKTTDGGTNWDKVFDEHYPELIKFYDENFGLIFCHTDTSATVFTTTNGGNDWIKSDQDFNSWPGDIEFLPGKSEFIWFGSFDSSIDIYYSSDSGENWSKSPSQPSGLRYTRDIVFVDSTHGWLLGDNNSLYYTQNNGIEPTGILNNDEELNNSFTLFQNYPNPFNPNTTIRFDINKASNVELALYNVQGQKVKIILSEFKPAGTYSVNVSAKELTSGVYFYELKANNLSKTRKMILLR